MAYLAFGDFYGGGVYPYIERWTTMRVIARSAVTERSLIQVVAVTCDTVLDRIWRRERWSSISYACKVRKEVSLQRQLPDTILDSLMDRCKERQQDKTASILGIGQAQTDARLSDIAVSDCRAQNPPPANPVDARSTCLVLILTHLLG